MNRVKTDINGGFPLKLDDLRFADNAIRLALSDMMKAFASASSIYIHGCQIVNTSGEIYQVSEGAIFHQGEIWHVDQHTVEFPDVPMWAFYISYDPAGNKTFKDGLQHNTYEIRKAVLCLPGSYPDNTLFTKSADLVKTLREVFLQIDTGQVTFGEDSTLLSDLSLEKQLGRVCFQAQVRNTYISSFGTIVLTLPAAAHPMTPVSGIIPGKITGTTEYINLRFNLDTNGVLRFYNESGVSCDLDLCLTFVSN